MTRCGMQRGGEGRPVLKPGDWVSCSMLCAVQCESMASLALKWLLVLTLVLWAPIQCCCSMASAMGAVAGLVGIETTGCPSGGCRLRSASPEADLAPISAADGAAIRPCCAARMAGDAIDPAIEESDGDAPSPECPCSCPDRKPVTAITNASAVGSLAILPGDDGGPDPAASVCAATMRIPVQPVAATSGSGTDPPHRLCTLVHQRVKLLI